MNYGGEKLWPAPQGWDHEAQWPGPPDPVLDGGPYASEVITQNGTPTSVKLISPPDPYSGLQFSRVLKIFDNSTRVNVIATMKNIDSKPRRWGIWSVAQLDARDRSGDGHNRNFKIYCPMHEESLFPEGYIVQFGAEDNPTFQPDYNTNLLTVHYDRQVGKVGLDSPGGWLATVDGTSGFVFVQRFSWEEEAEYPDHSSVEIWLSGRGEIEAWGKTITMTENEPTVVECELLSPFANLLPGEDYTFTYDWYTAKIGRNRSVVDCSNLCVTSKSLTAKRVDGLLSLAGHFGLFHKGTVSLKFYDGENQELHVSSPQVSVSPLKVLNSSDLNDLVDEIKIPPSVANLALCLYNKDAELLGELGKAKMG